MFENLPSRKVLQVLSIGSWTSSQTGEQLLESGKRVESIDLIVRGKVRVTRGERVLGELGAGTLVGSTLLLCGALSEVNAVVVEPVRALRLDAVTLERYLAANPETRIIMQRHLARDLAGKLGRLSNDPGTDDASFPTT
jgi:CRP-like cAMP-binding protein